MPEPCASCDEKDKDFGGCRCQAFMLTGEAANTDPVCSKSPNHALVTGARKRDADMIATDNDHFLYRNSRNSRLFLKE